MTFEEAVKQMEKGKVVARRSWPGFAREWGVGLIETPKLKPYFREMTHDILGSPFIMDYDDVKAIDWEVLNVVNPA